MKEIKNSTGEGVINEENTDLFPENERFRMFADDYSEAMFKLALEQNLEAKIAEFEAMPDCEVSPELDARIKAIIENAAKEGKQAKKQAEKEQKRPVRLKVLKQMLVAVVVLAVTFGMLMLCSANFREKITSLFEKWNGGYVSYTTTKILNPEDFIKKDFELGYVPRGLELTSIQYHDNSTMLWYTLPEEYSGTGVISANSLSKYVSVQFGIADDVPIDIDNEHCTIYKREDSGIEYTVHETDEATMANIILFVKEDYYFILRAPFTMGIEELYETAKNTVAVPFTEKELYESENSVNERFAKIQERKFEFTYLPEGVELRDTEVLGDSAGTVIISCIGSDGLDTLMLVYNKADGLGLNLTYETFDENGVKTQLIDGVCYFCANNTIKGVGADKMLAWGDSTYEFAISYDGSISFDEIIKVAQGIKDIK